jgi:hypothetical protein
VRVEAGPEKIAVPDDGAGVDLAGLGRRYFLRLSSSAPRLISDRSRRISLQPYQRA